MPAAKEHAHSSTRITGPRISPCLSASQRRLPHRAGGSRAHSQGWSGSETPGKAPKKAQAPQPGRERRAPGASRRFRAGQQSLDLGSVRAFPHPKGGFHTEPEAPEPIARGGAGAEPLENVPQNTPAPRRGASGARPRHRVHTEPRPHGTAAASPPDGLPRRPQVAVTATVPPSTGKNPVAPAR